MSRARYGDWGAGLGDVDFACALAAVGVAAAESEGAAGVEPGPTLRAFRRRIAVEGPAHYLWRDPADAVGWDPRLAATGRRWADAWRDAAGRSRPILGMLLDPSGAQTLWTAATLNLCADAYIPIETARSARPWRLPIRIGVLDDESGHALLRSLLGPHWHGDAIEPVVIGRERITCDILALPGPSRESMESIGRTREIRAGAVLAQRETETWSAGAIRTVTTRSQAWAIGIGSAPITAETLGEICRELSRNASFDQAFRVVCRPDGLVLADSESVGRLAIRRRALATAALLRELPSPAAHELAGEFMRVATSGVLESGPEEETSLLELEQRAAAGLREAGSRRSLQARITEDGRPEESLTRFRPGTTHRIDVFVGAHRRDWWRREADLPQQPAAHRLTIMLTEYDLLPQPQAREIDLPVIGDSGTVTFELTTRPETTSVHAHVIVSSGSRILLTGRLPTTVGPAEPSDSPVVRPGILVNPPTADLAERRSFDAMVFVGTSADGQPQLTVASGAEAATVRLAGTAVTAVMEKIRRRLTAVVMSNVQAGGLAEPDAVKLLIFFARRGLLLRMAIERDAVGATERLLASEYLQIVPAEADAYLPLELVYDFERPTDAATLCPHAIDALAVADGPGAPCPGPHAAEVVCPFGFWGLSKVIERQAFRPGSPVPGHYRLRGGPVRDRDRIPLGPVVLGASDRVDQFADGTLNSLLDTLQLAAPSVRQVATWTGWRTAVADCRPGVLLVLPHTVHSADFDEFGLEIGANDCLWSTQITPEVLPARDRPAIVALLGCATACSGKISYEEFPGLLRGAGAEVVIATLTDVLGRYAAPIGARLVEELYRACQRAPHGLGEIMLHLRRRLLAEGNLTVLSLAAFGDADWLITADGFPC